MDIGIAYYPEHWPRERWDEDFALMAEAGLTRVRMAEFAWCRLEPREGEFDFAWLDEAVELADRRGIRSILCTPTQAPPPWLSVNYPETRPWSPQGLPYAQGSRRHVDAASDAFQRFSMRITAAMGDYFGRDERVVGWQLDNEIGAHTHFVSHSPWAQAKFRQWLRRKYRTVDALNAAWGLIFWSGEVREWGEVELLTTAPTGVNPSYVKDMRTFGQELWIEFLHEQAQVLRERVGEQFITHNVAWYGEQIDLWKLAEFLDVAGIDIYAQRPELVTAVGDLYHAVACGKPWAVLEMGAGEGVWQDEQAAGPNKGRLAQVLVKHALSGASLASMFRFQTSPSGSEQFGGGGGLRDVFGRPTSTVQAVQEARRIIDAIGPVLQRPRVSDVAIVWDTDNLIWSEMWPIEGSRRRMVNDYPREVQEISHQFARRGIRPTYTHLGDDLSRFGVLIVWNHLLMDEAQAEALRRYVEGGGMVVSNYCMGYFTREGRRTACPVPYQLTDVFGCTVAELLPGGSAVRLAVGDALVAPATHACTLELLGAEAAGQWRNWQGRYDAGIATHRYGQGRTVYVASLLDREGWEAVMPVVFDHFGLEARNPIGEHPQIEAVPERGCWVVCNTAHTPVVVPVEGAFRDLASGLDVSGELRLEGYAVAVLEPA